MVIGGGRLLHVESSPRGVRSRSRAVAQRLIAELSPSAIETLNLFETQLPPLDGATIEGRYALIAGESVAPEVRACWADIRARIEHFLSFDGWIFSVPMWNFGIPYRLKHYIDLLTQPGMAFAVGPDGVEGLARGRTAILIGSGALDTRPGGDLAALDHQMAYLRTWLAFIGVTDIHAVDVRPTYGDEAMVETVMAQAYSEARSLAAILARPSRV